MSVTEEEYERLQELPSIKKSVDNDFDILASLADAADCGTEKEIASANEEIDKLKQEIQKKTDKLYARWCPMIMDKIEEIAKKHYAPHWWAAGSRYNVVLTMLEQFDEDLK